MTTVKTLYCPKEQRFTKWISIYWEPALCSLPTILWDCSCCSVIKSCLTLCNSMPGFPILHCLPELAQTHVCWASDAIQPSHPLSPPSLLPSVFPSIRVFSNESVLHIRCPKYLSHILWNKWVFPCLQIDINTSLKFFGEIIRKNKVKYFNEERLSDLPRVT